MPWRTGSEELKTDFNSMAVGKQLPLQTDGDKRQKEQRSYLRKAPATQLATPRTSHPPMYRFLSAMKVRDSPCDQTDTTLTCCDRHRQGPSGDKPKESQSPP